MDAVKSKRKQVLDGNFFGVIEKIYSRMYL